MLKFVLPAALVGLITIGGGGLYLLWSGLGLTEKVLATNAGQNANEALANLDDATRLNLDDPEKMNPFGMALRMMVEGGNTTKTPDIDLRGQLPAAPDGWYAKYYDTADGESIVDATIIRSMVSQGTTNNVLLDFDRAAAAGKRGEAQTYIRGPMMMAIRMYVNEQANTNTVQGGLMADIGKQLNAVSMGTGNSGRTKGLFAKYHGIEIVQQPQWSSKSIHGTKTPVDYRRFVAKLGNSIEIEVITNAADAHVAALFQNINMAALHGLLPVSLEAFHPDVGWQTASTEPLSDQPPGPSLARRAHMIANDGRIYSETETLILNEIIEGEITDWVDIVKEQGTFYEPSEMIKTLMGPMPDVVATARTASAMTRELEDELSTRDDLLLQMLARMDAQTQGDVIRSYNWNGDHHPRVLALINALPAGDLTAEEAMSYPAPRAVIRGQPTSEVAQADGSDVRPTVRRGLDARGDSARDGSCKIEHGVRRCVLDADGS